MAEKRKKLEEFNWTGNSKIMFDEMLKLLNPMYRAIFNKRFEVWLNKKEDGTIREINVKHTIDKNKGVLGKDYEKYMEIFNKYKTEPEE